MENLVSLSKVKATSMFPWENVRSTARYLRDVDRELELYNEQNKNMTFEYAALGLENKKQDDEYVRTQKEEDPECKPQHLLLTQDGLTVEQAQKRDEASRKLLDTQTAQIDVPNIDSKVIEKLYNDSQDRRKKQDPDKKPDPNDEPFFGVDDVRAYEVLGLLK